MTSELTTTTWTVDPGLTWVAALIGNGSDYVDGADEWNETRIYRTERATYIITGRRIFDSGERVFDWINVQRSARNVIKALTRVDRDTRDRYLPLGADTAIAEAATHDPAIRAALDAFYAGE